MTPGARYIPQLDGLRGVAIFGVLLFHAELFSLGWTGIVLFFVLSGFLITGILLDGKERAGYFGRFYARRALRIFPAYYFVLGLTWWMKREFTLSAPDPQIVSAVPEWIYFVLYVQNYWMAAQWFQTPLSHLMGFSWTLAVEEQFYLIWPLLVYFLGPRTLLLLCAALVAAAPLLRIGIVWASDNTLLAFSSLPAHLDGLAIGAAICLVSRDARLRIWLTRRSGGVLFVAAGIPLALLVGATGVAAYAATNQWMPLPGNMWFLTLASLVFGAVLILVLSGATRLSEAMNWRPLRLLGKISYGVYLYHTLAYFIVATVYNVSVFLPLPGSPMSGWEIVAIRATQIVVSIAMAAASYRYLERPLLQLKERFR